MKYNITKTKSFSLATITKAGADTVVAYISMDIHDQQSPQARAVQLLYCDAIISGAGKYTRAQFLDALAILGASISSGISDSVLTIAIRARAEVFKKVLVLVGTMLTVPRFDKHEILRIKKTTINALKESKEDTRAIALEQLRNTFYGQQDRRFTYDEDVLIAEISKVSQKDLVALHHKVCGLEWTVSIASNKEQNLSLQKSLSKLKFKVADELLSIHQQKTPIPVLSLKNIPSKQNIDFSIGVPVPITLHHPDYMPLRFALAILGGPSFSSRLMSTVREAEGLTYGISANAESFANEEQGYWRIGTFFAPDKSIQGLTSTFREIKKLYDHGITEEELDRYKIIHRTKQTLLNDSTARQLNDLHAYHLQKFSLKEITEHKNRTDTLTLDEVNHAIKLYLDPATLAVSGAGPVDVVKKQLQAFMKTVA